LLPALCKLVGNTTAVSPHTVSDYERNSYYDGVAGDGEHPSLLYRIRSAKYPWIRPAGGHAHPPKSLYGVHGTTLSHFWSAVGPQVRDLVKSSVKTCYSIDPAHFATCGEDRKNTLGPAVIWVTVYPGSTSAGTAHKVSQDILGLLKRNGVEDVEVEWQEAVTWKATGPALLPVVGSDDPTAQFCHHLTAALGIPIATTEREAEDAQGTVGFFFHENRDKKGNPSTKVFGVSNHHVLRKKVEEKYEFKGAGAPRQYVQVCGIRCFQRGLDEIKLAISDRSTITDAYISNINKLGEEGDVEEFHQLQQKLGEQKHAITALEEFYKNLMAQWGDITLRNIGHVHYSPPISVDVKGGRYTHWGQRGAYLAGTL